MTEPPILSIITVTFRDLAGLRRTEQSLRLLLDSAAGEIEWIIIDGGTEGILDQVAGFSPPSKLVSEPDDGVYDAMNKGLETSKGNYIWFLNGGDRCRLSEWTLLRRTLNLQSEALWLFSYSLRLETRSLERRPRGIGYLNHALPTSHQAIIYPGNMSRSVKYDLSYPISADYAFTAELVSRYHPLSLQSELVVAEFEVGGLSTERRVEVAHDAWRVQSEILRLSLALRIRSRARHLMSRTLIRLATTADKLLARRASDANDVPHC